MKNTKKAICLILALATCLSITACHKKKEIQKDKPQKTETAQEVKEETVENVNILSVFPDSKKELSLGDSKADITKALGDPQEESTYSMKYDGATVYMSDTVNMITITDGKYTVYNKLKVGMSIEDAKKKLKENEYYTEQQKDIGYFRMTVSIDENGQIIKDPTESTTLNAPYLLILTSNNFGKEDTITHIQIKDNRSK